MPCLFCGIAAMGRCPKPGSRLCLKNPSLQKNFALSRRATLGVAPRPHEGVTPSTLSKIWFNFIWTLIFAIKLHPICQRGGRRICRRAGRWARASICGKNLKGDKANKKASAKLEPHLKDKSCAHPFMKRNIRPPFHTDAGYFHLKWNSPPKVVLT